MTGKTEDGAPYMVLEYLPGRSLDERLRDDGPVPWREVVQVATQVARALEVLHRLGVIHRDVKPSNIMQLDSATGQPVVKLLDLGIAKVHDWQRVQAAGFTAPPRHQTDVGKVLGTPGFYPPEGGHVPAGPRFDVFGVGVTIYQLCTGELPDLVNPRPMRLVRPDCEVPPELDAVVMAAITVLPDDRIAHDRGPAGPARGDLYGVPGGRLLVVRGVLRAARSVGRGREGRGVPRVPSRRWAVHGAQGAVRDGQGVARRACTLRP